MTVIAVLLGGLLGTGLRLGIDALLPNAVDGFPTSTLLINTVGSLVLGILVARLWPTAQTWLRAGLGAGLLGSFTTFSAVAVSVFSLARLHEPGLAIGYLVTTLAAGWMAAALGIRLGGGRPTPIGPEE